MGSEPLQKHVRIGALDLSLFEWPGEDPAVLFVHATGFHARCWDGVARELAGLHMWAPDLRGHGRSSKLPPYRWDVFGRDLELLCETLGMEGCVGVGHSLGGHALIQAAAARPQSFRSLLLVDPVIFPPDEYAEASPPGDSGQLHFTAKRQRYFDSPEAMVERFRNRSPYSEWRPEILRDYCEHGLLPAPEGGYELACPPEIEASIYGGSRSYDIGAAIRRVEVPVVVLRARPRDPAASFDFSGSPTWPHLAAAFTRGRDVSYPELTHFIPMQAPDVVARHVRELISAS